MILEIGRLDRKRILKICAFICPAIVFIYFVLFYNPTGAIVSLLSDDAFYYCKIAKNIAEGQGCTFDGIAATNGFHPLWMIYEILIYRIAHSNHEVPVLIIIVTNGLLCLITLAMLYQLVEEFIAPRFGLIAVAVALLPNLLTAMLNGLETGLQLFAMVLVLRSCYKRNLLDPEAVGKGPIAFGIMLGIITLCRLDAVFLFIAAMFMNIAATAANRLSLRRSIHRMSLLSAGFVITLMPYLIWNFARFNHLTPISSTVKSSFPAIRRHLTLTSDTLVGAGMIAVVIVLVAFIVAASDYRNNRWRKAFSSPLVMLTLASLFHFANVFFFMSWGVYWWHFAIYGLTITIALSQGTFLLTISRPKLRSLVVAILVIPIIALAVVMKENELRIKGIQHKGWLQAAEWARMHTSPDALFAMPDAGLFGYFSDRRVICLDGKANGYTFLEYLNRGDVESYLRQAGTSYIANIRVEYVLGTHRISIPRSNRPSVILSMNQEWEVYRGPAIPSYAPRFGKVPQSRFVIWKVPYPVAN
jgi:hypothetical protein